MLVERYCTNACLSGIQDLYESRNHKGKFAFWAIVMITMVIASAWFTYRTIAGYIDTSTVTSVSTVRSSSMELPEVLICYNGGLNVSAMRKAKLSENLIKLFHWQFYKLYRQFEPVPFNDSDIISAKDELKLYTDRTGIGITDIVEKFSYNCSDIVVQFLRPTYDIKNCENVETVLTPKGKCYEFKNNTNQTYPALIAGIIVQLKSPKNSFYQLYPNEPREYDIGNDFSFTIEKKLGGEQSLRWITIAPNQRTEVTLSTKVYKRLSTKVPCENNPSIYNSNTCYIRCYSEQYVKVCNCLESTIWRKSMINNVSACNPFEAKCTLNQTQIKKNRECQANCTPMCSEWLFETSISSSSLESSNSSQAFVKIAYNTMQYTLIEEVDAFTLDMAIANVGGQSGLWLGCSIITIIQALYYVLLSIVNSIHSISLRRGKN